jgi:hypothetical protein
MIVLNGDNPFWSWRSISLEMFFCTVKALSDDLLLISFFHYAES